MGWQPHVILVRISRQQSATSLCIGYGMLNANGSYYANLTVDTRHSTEEARVAEVH